ncbi:hypothetical protein, partial [Plantibacter sp. CFBP 13570]|uniref:hypothetical protein n=1 Tax=Plantibacter sp. CFBP 13570 TaxID=2775272 RepID=UPI0019309B4B
MSCAAVDPMCWGAEAVQNVASGAFGKALQELNGMLFTAVGKIVAALASGWIALPSPALSGGEAPADAATTDFVSKQVNDVLGVIAWGAAAIAVGSLIVFGIRLALSQRRGDGDTQTGRFGAILTGALLVSMPVSIAAFVFNSAPPAAAGGAVGFLQEQLWWITGAMVIISVLIGGAKMMISQRGEAGKELAMALLRTLVVSTSGVFVVNLYVRVMDNLAFTVLNNATDQEFGEQIMRGFAVTSSVGIGPLIPIAAMTVASVCGFVQLCVLLGRNFVLVILLGAFPLAASFTNTEQGMALFRKFVGWVIAFGAYKLAAAICYAAAFQLFATTGWDPSGIAQTATGLLGMLLALFALPALLRIFSSITGGMGGSGGGAGLAMAGAGIGQMLMEGFSASGKGASESGSVPEGAAPTVPQSAPTGMPAPSGASTAAATEGAGAATAAGAGAGGAAAAGAGAGG